MDIPLIRQSDAISSCERFLEFTETYLAHPKNSLPRIDISLTTSQILTQPTQTF